MARDDDKTGGRDGRVGGHGPDRRDGDGPDRTGPDHGRYDAGEAREAEKLVRVLARTRSGALARLARGGGSIRSFRRGRVRIAGRQTFHLRRGSVNRAGGKERGKGGRAGDRVWAEPGRAVQRQAYIEGREPKRPEAVEASFGTLGETWEERKAFWEEAGRRERRGGRVAQTLIAELPHQLTPAQRAAALRDFCERALGAQNLPYWAVVHRPDPHGDERNFHAHVLFYDRPGERGPDGRWRFRGKARERYPWGTEAPGSREKRLRRRLAECEAAGRHAQAARFRRELDELEAWRREGGRPEPGPDVHRKGWLREMRSLYAEVVNGHLERAGIEVDGHALRYDPRSYREMGVDRVPGRHLGPAASSLERKGVVTVPGLADRRAARLDAQERLAEELEVAEAELRPVEAALRGMRAGRGELGERRREAAAAAGEWCERRAALARARADGAEVAEAERAAGAARRRWLETAAGYAAGAAVAAAVAAVAAVRAARAAVDRRGLRRDVLGELVRGGALAADSAAALGGAGIAVPGGRERQEALGRLLRAVPEAADRGDREELDGLAGQIGRLIEEDEALARRVRRRGVDPRGLAAERTPEVVLAVPREEAGAAAAAGARWSEERGQWVVAADAAETLDLVERYGLAEPLGADVLAAWPELRPAQAQWEARRRGRARGEGMER